jgi:hypothetical protein
VRAFTGLAHPPAVIKAESASGVAIHRPASAQPLGGYHDGPTQVYGAGKVYPTARYIVLLPAWVECVDNSMRTRWRVKPTDHAVCLILFKVHMLSPLQSPLVP